MNDSQKDISPKNKILILLVGLGIIGLAGVWILARSIPDGLGLVNDSGAYISGAESLMAGDGYTWRFGPSGPITHFPPFFSLLLAGAGILGSDLFQAARIMILFLFGVNIVLVGVSIYRIAGSLGFAWLGALLLAISDRHLGVYSLLLSEPLFTTLMLSAFLILAQFYAGGKKTWLVLCGLAIGLAFLTRLAGLSLYVTVAITILLLSLPLRRALRYMGIVFASGLPFLLGWFTYTLTAAGALANRQLAYHPLPPERWFDALKNLLSWLAPDMVFRMLPLLSRLYSFLSLLLIPALMIALYLGWTAWRGREVPDGANIPVARAYARQNPGGFSLAFSLAIHILTYLLFLFLSISLFDASTPLDDRLLSMVYTPLIILSCSALAWMWGRMGRRTELGRWLVAGVLFVLVAVNAWDGYQEMLRFASQGQGFNHASMRQSPAMTYIENLGDVRIYTNRPAAVYLLTGRSALHIPTPFDPARAETRLGYADSLSEMQQAVLDGRAVLVLFNLKNSVNPEDAQLYLDLSAGLPLFADYGNVQIFERP